MNNTTETNQSYQKFKEILAARRIISQFLSTGCVFKIVSNYFKLFHVVSN